MKCVTKASPKSYSYNADPYSDGAGKDGGPHFVVNVYAKEDYQGNVMEMASEISVEYAMKDSCHAWQNITY